MILSRLIRTLRWLPACRAGRRSRRLEQFAGEFGLLLVHRQELGGGLEVRAGQTRVGVRAVLLRGAAAVPVGQGVGCSGEPVFDPLGVRGDRGRVEAEPAALDVDSGLAVPLELGADAWRRAGARRRRSSSGWRG